MWSGVYYIIVVAAAVWAVVTGFRRGFMRQTGGVLAVAFGIAASRILSPELSPSVDEWLPPQLNGFNRPFVCATLTCGGIYLIVAALVSICSLPLGKLLGMLGMGVLNSIGGAVFRLFRVLLVVSIFYNLISDLSPAGDLTRTSSLHDGNIVEGVIKIAPPLLGFQGAEEVAFRQQMEEAKKIS